MVRSVISKENGIFTDGGACFGRDFLRHRGSRSIALGLDRQSREKALL